MESEESRREVQARREEEAWRRTCSNTQAHFGRADGGMAEHRNRLTQWLEGYKWQVWLTLTFKEAVSLEGGWRYAREVTDRLGEESYGFLAIEEGELFGRTNLHLLLGWRTVNLPERKLLLFRLWIERTKQWGKHASKKQIEVERYEERGGAVAYTQKVTAERPEQGLIFGRPKKLRRRKD